MNNIKLIVVLLAALSAVMGAPQCQSSDGRPSWWCNARINANSALCRTDETFAWSLCCNACTATFGGQGQANKEDSFMNTKAPCSDNANAAAYCATLKSGTGSTTCATAGNDALVYCKNSCGYCSNTNIWTTANPCTSFSTCYNNTYCNSASSTTGKCTPTGASITTVNKEQFGTCDCSTCISKNGAECSTDSDCAGTLGTTITGDCQFETGKCTAPTCANGNGCRNDFDCGGYAGTCLKAVAFTNYADVFTFTRCKTTDTDCTCRGCPTKDCQNEDQICTTNSALCGEPSACIVTVAGTTPGSTPLKGETCATGASECRCRCKNMMQKSATTELTAQTGDATKAPFCVHQSVCSAPTTGPTFTCGNRAHCLGYGTGIICAALADAASNVASPLPPGPPGSTLCHCNCTDVNIRPFTSGASCTVGDRTGCNTDSTTNLTPGAGDDMYVQACQPDTSVKGKCRGCGASFLQNKVSNTTGKYCGTDQTICQDGSYCVTNVCTTGSACSEQDCGGTPGICGRYGKCYTKGTTNTCISTNLADCACNCGGCKTSASCDQTKTSSYCGGLFPACQGRCTCV